MSLSSVVFVMVVYRPFLNSVLSIPPSPPDYNSQNVQNYRRIFVQFADKKVLDKNSAIWYNGKTARLPEKRQQTRRQKDASFLHLRPKERRIYYE
jgi:hypothetical protein